ncbi:MULTISPECIES: hypothetical protein [Arthrobacter]|uniref:Uncharacterized protein n=2 Tax=Arthrobacter TaxID=1663 RepID=A0ABU9KKS2_9MICC|nr:hypothetical protein [Arthrobacter sp. YJM1]MDP5227396.1 hypothetical protein [Arthrobacter sp. YJM1]
MTKVSWLVHLRSVTQGTVIFTVQCRGKGQLTVSLHTSVGPDYGVSGDCGASGEPGTFAGSMQTPPDGVIDVSVTVPPGAEWALLVTQPAGS